MTWANPIPHSVNSQRSNSNRTQCISKAMFVSSHEEPSASLQYHISDELCIILDYDYEYSDLIDNRLNSHLIQNS